MRRRDFLALTSRTMLGASMLPLVDRMVTAQNSRESTGAKDSQVLIDKLMELLPRLMAEDTVPGLAFALIGGGKSQWHRGFGVKDNASKEPVSASTVFEAASVSKTVFAYAVMKLCEQGTMDLDTPLTKYASERFLADDPRLDLITARHVLSHTSGFQDWRSQEAPLKIHFTPGQKFLYSGEGYHYLQSVVTHLKGKVDPSDCDKYESDYQVCATDFDPYMKRNLLQPFGMTSSGYVWNDTIVKEAARPHDAQGKPLTKKKARGTDVARYGSAGGLQTTAADYAKFLIEVINPKPADDFRLSRKSLSEMLRPQVKLEEGEKIDGAGAWALGWAIQERQEGNYILHSGGQEGFRSLAMARVENKSGFVILTNGDNGGKVIHNPAVLDLLGQWLNQPG